MAEKTAASLGERAGDAYADSASVAGTSSGSRPGMADRALSAGQHMAQGVSDQFSDQRFVSIIAAFGLGFIAAVLLQRRR
jgi:hypothetical protein